MDYEMDIVRPRGRLKTIPGKIVEKDCQTW